MAEERSPAGVRQICRRRRGRRSSSISSTVWRRPSASSVSPREQIAEFGARARVAARRHANGRDERAHRRRRAGAAVPAGARPVVSVRPGLQRARRAPADHRRSIARAARARRSRASSPSTATRASASCVRSGVVAPSGSTTCRRRVRPSRSTTDRRRPRGRRSSIWRPDPCSSSPSRRAAGSSAR